GGGQGAGQGEEGAGGAALGGWARWGRGRGGRDRRVGGGAAPDRPGGAEEGVFLVHAARHDDVGGAARLLADDAGERGQHRRHAALDVAGAAAVEPAVFDPGGERVDGHVVGRHRVLVGVQDQGAAGGRRGAC